MAEMTLEQRRAQDAWACAKGCTSEYVRLAKGLPALIMNSGLLQVLAYLEDKSTEHGRKLSVELRRWLCNRYPKQLQNSEFEPFMEALMATGPRDFQRITQEAFAWLRWLRQVAPAVTREG